MNTTDYAYDSKFEQAAMALGINPGMFAFSDATNGYISPVIRAIYADYKNGCMTFESVQQWLNTLK